MTDCYKTNKECLREVQEKANKYDDLINKINKAIKEHRTLVDFLEELKK